MQLGLVIGHATATIKHPSLAGRRLAVAQLLDAARRPDGDPVLAVDVLGSGVGQVVLLNSDGQAARELVRDAHSPVRWFVAGVVDEEEARPA